MDSEKEEEEIARLEAAIAGLQEESYLIAHVTLIITSICDG